MGSLYQQSLCQRSPLSWLSFGSFYLIRLPFPSPYLPIPIPLPLIFHRVTPMNLLCCQIGPDIFSEDPSSVSWYWEWSKTADSKVNFSGLCYSLPGCKEWPSAPDALMPLAQGSSLFIKLLPVVTQEWVLVEDTSLVSAMTQAFKSEQSIQGQWTWLVTIKGYEGIFRNWRQWILKY